MNVNALNYSIVSKHEVKEGRKSIKAIKLCQIGLIALPIARVV